MKETRHRGGKIWTSLVSVLIVASIPIIMIGLVYRVVWTGRKAPVDRKTCRCSCFDTIFKGQYERPGENVGYKHIYFNATGQTAAVWVITLAFAVLAYESFRQLLGLLAKQNLRLPMAATFLANIYPSVYGWWVIFNYFNDDFYSLLVNQLYFTVTELVSTFFILRLCASNVAEDLDSCIIIVATSINHILIGGANQFFLHFVLGQGHQYQLSRDWGLFLPDVICLLVAGAYLSKTWRLQRTTDIGTMHLRAVLKSKTTSVMCYSYVLCITILGFTMY